MIWSRNFWPNFDLKCRWELDGKKFPIWSTKKIFFLVTEEIGDKKWWPTFANCLDSWVLGVSLSKSDAFFLTYLLILKILYFCKNSNGDIFLVYVGVISLIRDSFLKWLLISHSSKTVRLCFPSTKKLKWKKFFKKQRNWNSKSRSYIKMDVSDWLKFSKSFLSRFETRALGTACPKIRVFTPFELQFGWSLVVRGLPNAIAPL